MELTPYLEALQRDLAAAAAPGGPECTAPPTCSAARSRPRRRLCLLEALSDAAAEITTKLEPTPAVEVRLRGREAQFVVISRAGRRRPRPPADRPGRRRDPSGDIARITLRLPEGLKEAVERGRRRAVGISVNAWLVRAITSAVAGESRPTPAVARQHRPAAAHRLRPSLRNPKPRIPTPEKSPRPRNHGGVMMTSSTETNVHEFACTGPIDIHVHMTPATSRSPTVRQPGRGRDGEPRGRQRGLARGGRADDRQLREQPAAGGDPAHDRRWLAELPARPGSGSSVSVPRRQHADDPAGLGRPAHRRPARRGQRAHRLG